MRQTTHRQGRCRCIMLRSVLWSIRISMSWFNSPIGPMNNSQAHSATNAPLHREAHQSVAGEMDRLRNTSAGISLGGLFQ
jgi:hypothetical protein